LLTRAIILKKIEARNNDIKSFGVKKLGLFGSFATGRQKKNSDIDFLVEFEPGKKNFRNYMSLKLFLEDLFERQVDLVTANGIREELQAAILDRVVYASGL